MAEKQSFNMNTIRILTIYITLSLILLSSKSYKCQTVYLDNKPISIGDSLKYVVQKFSNPSYHVSVDTLGLSLRYTISKKLKSYDIDTSFLPLKLLGRLYFYYSPPNFPIKFTKTLYKISKLWGYYEENNPFNLLKNINDILEKNEIDKYSMNLSISKDIEPDYSRNTITIRINSFTLLQIYFIKDIYYEISEIITDNNRFSDKEYIVIFEDPLHFIGKENIIVDIYETEEEAENRLEELEITYLTEGLDTPNDKIIRFTKNSFSDVLNFDVKK